MTSLAERIDRFELELRRMDAELRVLKLQVPTETVAPPRPPRPAVVAARPVPPPAPSPARPRPTRPRIDVAGLVSRVDLLGAGGLAVVGGAVTALGITLLFVLAAEQGWIGPVARVGAGVVASMLVFAAGLFVRQRYGQVTAGLAAVAAGIAGAYATLAAAAALYDLVPDAAALGLAAGIAGLAVTVSLAWCSELVAVLGLLGAALAPALQGLESGIAPDGLAFAVVVLVATAVVSVIRCWDVLLAAVTTVVGAQAAWLVVLEGREAGAATLAVIGVLAGVILSAACAWQVRAGTRELQRLTVPLVLADLGFILLTSHVLFAPGSERGIALAVAATVFAFAWIVLGRRQRDLGVVLAAGFFGLGAVAVGGLVSGDGLTLSWAAEAALLAVLAHRFRDVRLQVAGLAYLGLATGHLLVVGEPFAKLFDLERSHVATAVATLAVALAAVSAALLAPRTYRATGERGLLAFVGRLRDWLEARRPRLVELLAASAATLALVAFGLAAVAVDPEAGHVALSAMAALTVVAGTVVAARRRAAMLAAAVYLAAFVVAFESVAFDLGSLPSGWGAVGALLAAAGLLASGALLRVCWRTPARLGLASGLAATAALALALSAIGTLAPDDRYGWAPDRLWFGVGTALVALVYLALAALTRTPRLRNLSTTALGSRARAVAARRARADERRRVARRRRRGDGDRRDARCRRALRAAALARGGLPPRRGHARRALGPHASRRSCSRPARAPRRGSSRCSPSSPGWWCSPSLAPTHAGSPRPPRRSGSTRCRSSCSSWWCASLARASRRTSSAATLR